LDKKKEFFGVDNTQFIEKIEKNKGKAFVWLRPKTFWDYNILYKDKFQENFGHLYIGKHPTKEQGSYYVLNIDFATLDTRNVEIFEKSLDETIKDACEDFNTDYKASVQICSDYIETLANLMTFIIEKNSKVKRKYSLHFFFF
jgi:hypothetical protein